MPLLFIYFLKLFPMESNSSSQLSLLLGEGQAARLKLRAARLQPNLPAMHYARRDFLVVD